jgi:acetylornithine deacetylase/succinyl-diaminopimelate desuccinylase-like protein
MGPSSAQRRLIDRVEADREEIVGFLRGFLRARSPNPPGDTRDACMYVTDYLDSRGVEYEVVGPDAEKPNIVSNFKADRPGRRLVLNGHMDVFPVGSGEGWSRDP